LQRLHGRPIGPNDTPGRPSVSAWLVPQPRGGRARARARIEG
jgi:hypothetical protein